MVAPPPLNAGMVAVSEPCTIQPPPGGVEPVMVTDRLPPPPPVAPQASQGKTPSQTQTQPRTENPNRSPSQEQVAKRAYQIFQARGGEHGRHLEDWEQAEQELKLGM